MTKTKFDYEANFIEIDEQKWLEVGAEFEQCRVFKTTEAKRAWEFAAQLDQDGVDITIAKFCGMLYVWSVSV